VCVCVCVRVCVCACVCMWFVCILCMRVVCVSLCGWMRWVEKVCFPEQKHMPWNIVLSLENTFYKEHMCPIENTEGLYPQAVSI